MIPSGTISVADFFQQANWEGLRLVTFEADDMDNSMELVEVAATFIPPFNLKVQDFFASHNWHGIRKTKTVRSNLSSSEAEVNNAPNYCLSMSVEEFFQRMTWKGKKAMKKSVIASVPPSVESGQSPSKSWNVNDLSDLL